MADETLGLGPTDVHPLKLLWNLTQFAAKLHSIEINEWEISAAIQHTCAVASAGLGLGLGFFLFPYNLSQFLSSQNGDFFSLY